MKIFATKFTQMPTADLIALMESDPSRITQVLLEASRRGVMEIIVKASELPYLTVEHINILLKCITEQTGRKMSPVIAELVFYNILNRPESIINGVKSELLMDIMSSNPKLAAVGLLSEGLTKDLVYHLVDIYELNIVAAAPWIADGTIDVGTMLKHKKSDFATGVLAFAIALMREEGVEWRNKYSGLMLTTRLVVNRTDQFMTETAKYNLNFGLANALINASEKYQQNRAMSSNLHGNQNYSVQAAIDLTRDQQHPTIIIPKLINLLARQEMSPSEVWEIVKGGHRSNKWALNQILGMPLNNNVVLQVFRASPVVAKDILTTISGYVKSGDINSMSSATFDSSAIEEITHESLNNPALKDYTLQVFPKTFFDIIPLSDQDRQIVNAQFQTKPLPTTEPDEQETYKPSSLKRLFT